MADERGRASGGAGSNPNQKSGGFLGSLREALAAASREDNSVPAKAEPKEPQKALPAPSPEPASTDDSEVTQRRDAAALSAAEAAREARSTTTLATARERASASDPDAPPTTRVIRPIKESEAPVRTQLVRGKQEVKRGEFHQDPVVGWLVIVGGPGLGAYRPIFEGNNTVGRSSGQRIAIDFGDESISSEEQAYIRYDSAERSFLFVPNLAKTNVVSINNKRPTAAVELVSMDIITMGRTQIVFVPFCGREFDWSDIADHKS